MSYHKHITVNYGPSSNAVKVIKYYCPIDLKRGLLVFWLNILLSQF